MPESPFSGVVIFCDRHQTDHLTKPSAACEFGASYRGHSEPTSRACFRKSRGFWIVRRPHGDCAQVIAYAACDRHFVDLAEDLDLDGWQPVGVYHVEPAVQARARAHLRSVGVEFTP